MNQLFLCYRRNGAQTAMLFKFYMNRNHPEIKVWYSDLEKEGNFTLDISNLIKLSYGAVIFLSKGFTKGFLDKEGCINANRYRDDHREECVTVQEIIAIEKAIQMRKAFELHIINLDGATLNRRDQKVLEKVFQQAGILTEDSIAHFAQRNMNFFDTSREDEERFFNRMVGAYMPNNVQAMIRGNFSLGNHNTTVEVLSWDCHRFIPVNNINFELTNEETSLYDQIEYAPVQDKPLLQDDDVLSLIIKLCYEQLISTAQLCSGLMLPQKVNFLLDEFSNMPAIPDMNAMISAARSRNIRFYLIVQGLYQLSSKYGQEDAQTIKGNCGNWAFLTSRELPLLNEISDLCGQDALTGEKLITVSQLQRLNKERGEVLILLGRQYPYIAHLADISEYVMPEPTSASYPSLPFAHIRYMPYDQILKSFREKTGYETFEMPSLDDLFMERFEHKKEKKQQDSN